MSIQVSPSTIPNPEDVGLTAASDRKDAYLSGLLNQCQRLEVQVIDPDIAALLKELRDRASLWVNKLTIPTKRDEEWRFTDLSPLLQVNFQTPDKFDLPQSAAAEFALPEVPVRLVFVNGVYAPNLSAVADLPEGLIVGNLAQLPTTHRTKVGKYLAQQQGAATEVFTALNTAGLTDVAVVWVPRNQQIETPIHLVFVSTTASTPTVSQPRCLVVAQAGSQLTLIEDYKAAGAGVYFTNAVTEIVLEENAQVNHTRNLQEGGEAFHIGKSAIAQSRNSRYTCNAITIDRKSVV